MAGFCPQLFVEEGNRKPLLRPWQTARRPSDYSVPWSLTIAGRREPPIKAPESLPLDHRGRMASGARPAAWLQLPGFGLEAAVGPLASPADTPVNVVSISPPLARPELGFASGRRKPSALVSSVIPPAMAAAGPMDWPPPAPTPAAPKSAEAAPPARTPASVPPVREPIPAAAGPANAAPVPAAIPTLPRLCPAAPSFPVAAAPGLPSLADDASMVEGGHADCLPPCAAPVLSGPVCGAAEATPAAARLIPPAAPAIALACGLPSGGMAAIQAYAAPASDTPRMSARGSAGESSSFGPLLPPLSVESTAAVELDQLAAPVLNPPAHDKFAPAATCEPAARWLDPAAAVQDIPYAGPTATLPAFGVQPVAIAKTRSLEPSWVRPVATLAPSISHPIWSGMAVEPAHPAMRIPTAMPAGVIQAAPPQAELARLQPLVEIPAAKPVDSPAQIACELPPLRIPALPDPEKILPKGSAPTPAARPADSTPQRNGAPEPMSSPLAAPQPLVAAAQTAALRPAPFRTLDARPAFPPPMYWNPNVAVLDPLPPRLFRPGSLVWELNAGIAEGGFVDLDFYLQRGGGRPAQGAPWVTPVIGLSLPELTLQKVNEREAPAPAPVKEASKEKERDKLKVLEVPKRKRPAAFYVGRIAACLVAGFALWLSAHLLRLSTAPSDGDMADASQTAAARTEVATAADAAQEQSWLRRTIRNRAAVQVGDTFQSGMKAWGTQGNSWASGWSRSADGYVRPGALALFQPSMTFTDYRLEFNGQIENKGLSWVVRARDNNNYYGMKLSVVEPGLRPVLAIAHYTVVEGRKGRKMELPLMSVMVHRNTPLQVAVEVTGRRVTTSIDGQEVDSWTDTALAKGGVGFLSEAGERSRLYWMRVSKNQDWLGSICSYLSGGSGQTAEVRAPRNPDIPSPAAPPRREDVAVVSESLEYRRNGRWNS